MKGKGHNGCSICGSRGHQASSFPVGSGGGKGGKSRTMATSGKVLEKAPHPRPQQATVPTSSKSHGKRPWTKAADATVEGERQVEVELSQRALGRINTTALLRLILLCHVHGSDCSCQSVLGEKWRGLLVDPRAASGLSGSETSRGLTEHCIKDSQAKDITWNYDRANNVSGILATQKAPWARSCSQSICLETQKEASEQTSWAEQPCLAKQHAAVLTN